MSVSNCTLVVSDVQCLDYGGVKIFACVHSEALPGEGVGIDIRVFFGPLFWVIALVAFATAFYWMFRRTAG